MRNDAFKRFAVSVALTAAFVIALTAAPACAAAAKDLEAGFRNPPHSAGIRCFWWWLNSNVTQEAITRDLEEMKAKGFSGALIFDAGGAAAIGNRPVPAGPVFGGPEWTKLFVHACKEARRLDLELSLNLQSGWNLGGPKVTAEESPQQLVWSRTTVQGPATVEQLLPLPKHKDFYRDVAVLAVPVSDGEEDTQTDSRKKAKCVVSASSSQRNYPAVQAMDGTPDTFWVSQNGPAPDSPQWLLLTLSKPVKVSELSMRGRRGHGPREGKIQVSSDDKAFRTVAEFSLKNGDALKARFDEQPARYVRLLFTGAYDSNPVGGKPRNVQVAEIVLPGVRSPLPPMKDLLLKSATQELGGSAPDCRYLLNTPPAVPGKVAVKSGDILNLSAKMDKPGTLRWDVPKGEWVVLRVGHTPSGAHVSTHSAGWGGRVVDYMNSDSLHVYWNRNIEPLFKAIGPMAGTVLRYVHTDSWEGGGMNWTPGFDRTFRENRGYDPLPWLAVLAGYLVDGREDSNAFLADFRKTIGDRVADHYGLLAELARKHGMGTHPECSGPHAGPLDGLKNYGRSELMMSEFWSPSPHRGSPDSRFFVKQASSAAHTYGRRLVGAEAFTTIGPNWNDVPWSAMKPTFAHEFCAGLNLAFVHTFTCSPREMGLPGQEYFAGTHFNPQLTWWDEAPVLIDYLKRCQYLAQQGEFVADVVYYYGDHIPNIFGRKAHDPAGALPGYDYDVLSEELLLSGLTVEGGRLVLPSGMQYRVLVLPDHRVLSSGALRKVDELVRAGATVLGPKPLRAVSLEGGAEGKAVCQQLADGLWGPEEQAEDAKGTRKVGKGRVAWGVPARDLLQTDGIAPDVMMTLEDGSSSLGMDWIHYRIGDAEVYFLAELAGKARNIDAVFRVHGRVPELWNAVDGSMREAVTFKFVDGRTRVPLEFDSYGSTFVVFRKQSASDRDDGPNFPAWREEQVISGPWDVTFDPRWGGPEEPVRFDALTDWIEHSDPGIKYYSGKAVYRTTFNLVKVPADGPLALELGSVKDVGIARVTLNGKDLGVLWLSPFRVDIREAVKPGENRLEVMVVNSWHNRVMGDDALPENKRFTRTNVRVTEEGRFKWTLEESGLLGPVRIVEKVAGGRDAE